MHKSIPFLVLSIIAIPLLLISCATTGVKSSSYNRNYAEDRAQIEDLQARYLFALDHFDLDTYVSTFTEDGILDIVGMKWQGKGHILQRGGITSPIL